jgi:hypothetical protein
VDRVVYLGTDVSMAREVVLGGAAWGDDARGRWTDAKTREREIMRSVDMTMSELNARMQYSPYDARPIHSRGFSSNRRQTGGARSGA